MSNRWPGGLIRKTPVTPAGPFQNGAAPGMWTLAEASYWTKQGLWPIAGNFLAVEDVFSTWLYTGNSSTQTITNGIDLAGKGGLVWRQGRSVGTGGFFIDTARGIASYLISSSTGAATTGTNWIDSFNSNGFTMNVNSLNGGATYVSWTFREAPNFFDVVTGTQSVAGNVTLNHSLGIAPGLMIIKNTDGVNNDWNVYHRSLGTGQYLRLQTTDAASSAYAAWGGVAPTATQFTIGYQYPVATNFIAYLFAHDPSADGIIQCGSFTTDGSGNASVTLGWEPQWVMFKSSSTGGAWIMLDNMRGWNVSGDDEILSANSANAAASFNYGAPNATGFSVTGATFSSTFIYIAIRRGPMRTPTLGTSVFSPTATSTDTATTGFPVDLIVEQPRTTSGVGAFWGDRLRGAARGLNSSNTNAETTWFTSTWSQSNTGVTNTGMGYGSSALWSFRRAPGFFDEVCYTGVASTNTINHNLGVAPELIIIKSRSNAQQWGVMHTFAPTTLSINSLNTDAAAFSSNYATILWATGQPTSTQFALYSGSTSVNTFGATYVAYLFASVPGVSKVGSYTGNGSSQTINCAFTTGARFVLIKRTDSTGDWYVWDSARGIVAGNDPYLALNSTAAEVTTNDSVDTDNTGFIVNQVAASNINVNAATYIFLAIA